MYKSKALTGLFILILLATVVGCGGQATESAPTTAPTKAPAQEPTSPPAASGNISVAGSTTVQPIAELLAEAFTAQHPNVQVDIQGGGSSVGVKSAGEGTVDIGAASREIKSSELDEFPNLKIFTIARDGIAIAVHPGVAVDGLSTDQVRDIFAGEIANWNEAGGPDAIITVIAREEGSGTRGAFEELVMGKDGPPIVDTALLFPSNGAVRTALSTTPDSIGFLSFGYLDESVKALQIDGVEATEANAKSGVYPVVRPLNMLTNGEPVGIVKEWLDFILSDEGQAIVEEEGYLSVVGASEATAPTTETEGLSGRINVAGSTTVQPLAEACAEAFSAQNPGVQVDIQGGGSSVGVKSAGEGTVDIGAASRAVKESELVEFPDLKVFTIARDGIAIGVHPGVPVDGLTTDHVREIFAGAITNWNEAGGPDAIITVIAREEGSGTRGAFEELAMGEESPIVDTALLFPSNGALRTALSTTPNSIGFLSFGYLDESVKALQIDGVPATTANALSGAYPIVRPLNMMTQGEPTGAAQAFIDFILGDAGQAIAVEEGYLSISGAAEPSASEGLSGQINVAGSTTVQPLSELLAEAFGVYHNVQVDVQGGGSSVGVKSAGEGTVDIGAASREIKSSELDEFPNLEIFTIARDGIAIGVHPGVAVDGLTKDQVRDIFAGAITNWNEAGGPDAIITVIAREEGSGTRGAFEEMVMGDDGPAIVDTALLFPSNGALRTALSTTPNSIGFLSFGYLDESVKALQIDGVAATAENAQNGAYPVVRPLNMLTNGKPTGVVKVWLDFILGPLGQQIVVDEGYLPVK